MTHEGLAAPRFPYPPFPDSWYAVCWANEVKKSIPSAVRAFGKDLVVFRVADGSVLELDAHCPHLGAHIGHGGSVVGDTVVCPFHGWRFTGDGRCTAAPGARKLPEGQALRTWATRELHDRIWVWYAEADGAPAWELPDTLLDPAVRWPRSARLVRTFPSHPQDVIENAVDPGHFQFIHGMSEVTDSETQYSEHGLTTRLKARTESGRLGVGGDSFSGTITVNVYGMGLQTIHTVMRSERLGLTVNTVVVESLTPREPGEVTFLLSVYMAPLPVPGAAWFAKRAFVSAVASDVDADIQIWANRRYLDHPRLTAADSEIGRFRVWARRFYAQSEVPVTAGTEG